MKQKTRIMVFMIFMCMLFMLLGYGMAYEKWGSKYNDLKNNLYDVNRDGKINASDYVEAEKIKEEIKKIIMERG